MLEMRKANHYSILSQVYDEMTNTSLYSKRTDFIVNLLKEFKVKKIVDLACGTGNITVILSENGFECIGIDASLSMLKIAKEKSKKITFLEKNIINLNSAYF